MSTLTVKPGVLLSPVEDGYVAYDPSTDTLHQLNAFAALLTELCDGSRRAEEIRALVAPLLSADRIQEIDQWMATAQQAGLLVPSDGQEAAAREFSAAELFDLVQRLKNYGKMQTAYICAKRVVELDPEDWTAWYLLGDLCQYVGKREEARDAFQKYAAAHPEDLEIEHLLVALRDEAPPDRVSDRTIQHIYKGFAHTFDGRLVDDLKYQGPERLFELVTSVRGSDGGLAVLDLGCGSGLAGLRLKPLAASLTGIDLSPEMLELARQRGVYDRLEVAEITTWLESGSELFDLITCCDCLIYFGDLNRIAAAAARRLKNGGVFAFSLERGQRKPFVLTDTGRYEHHPDHIREVAMAQGLAVAGLTEAFLRYEYTVEVMGLFAALRRSA
jgi:predicted TPR repeat methyltransferase